MRNLRPRVNGKVPSTSAVPTTPLQLSPTPKSPTKKSKLRPNTIKAIISAVKPISSGVKKKQNPAPSPKKKIVIKLNLTRSQIPAKITIKLNLARTRAGSVSTVHSDVSYESGWDDDTFKAAIDRNPYENPLIEDFEKNSALPVVMKSIEGYRPYPAEQGQKYKMMVRMKFPRELARMVAEEGFGYAIASGLWGQLLPKKVMPYSAVIKQEDLS